MRTRWNPPQAQQCGLHMEAGQHGMRCCRRTRPTCSSTVQASVWPRMAAQCRLVQPSLSGRLHWQPSTSSKRSVSARGRRGGAGQAGRLSSCGVRAAVDTGQGSARSRTFWLVVAWLDLVVKQGRQATLQMQPTAPCCTCLQLCVVSPAARQRRVALPALLLPTNQTNPPTCKALVCGPVQRGAAVRIQRICVSAPLECQVVQGGGLAVLCSHMAHRVTPAGSGDTRRLCVLVGAGRYMKRQSWDHSGTSGCPAARVPAPQQWQLQVHASPNCHIHPKPHLESRAPRSAPARSIVSSAAVLPRTAAQCSALCPVPSAALTSQPRSKR